MCCCRRTVEPPTTTELVRIILVLKRPAVEDALYAPRRRYDGFP